MATDPIYQIHLKEYLSAQWAEWFDPLRIEYAANGETRLVGPLRDQSASVHRFEKSVYSYRVIAKPILTAKNAKRAKKSLHPSRALRSLRLKFF